MTHSAFTIFDDFIIWVAGTAGPTCEEWASYMALTSTLIGKLGKSGTPLRRIIFTDGGAPGTLQREQLFAIREGIDVLSSVVTDSRVPRALLTVFEWFNFDMTTYPPHRIVEALHHVRISEARFGSVWQAVRELERRIPGGVRAVRQADPIMQAVTAIDAPDRAP